jgi:hypothetical protein
MRSVTALAALLAVLAAPARAADQIVNYENVAISVRSGAPSAAQVREAIMAAGKARQWEFIDDSPGKLTAVLRVRERHEIHVLIPYDQRFYSVLYESSVNMNYRPQDGTIHSNYNRWVRDFVSTINVSLSRISGGSAVAVASPAGPPPVPGYTDVPMPQVGDTWTYRLTEPDRRDGPTERNYVVTVGAANRNEILDQVVVGDGRSTGTRHTRGIQVFAQASGIFSPYLMVFDKRSPGSGLGNIGIADPACRGQYLCEVSGHVISERYHHRSQEIRRHQGRRQRSWRPLSPRAPPARRRVIAICMRRRPARDQILSLLSFGDTGPMGEPTSPGQGRIAPDQCAWSPRRSRRRPGTTGPTASPTGARRTAQRIHPGGVGLADADRRACSLQGSFTQPWRHTRAAISSRRVSVFCPTCPSSKDHLGSATSRMPTPPAAASSSAGRRARSSAKRRSKSPPGAPAIKVVVSRLAPAAGASSDAKELARMNSARTLTIWYRMTLPRSEVRGVGSPPTTGCRSGWRPRADELPDQVVSRPGDRDAEAVMAVWLFCALLPVAQAAGLGKLTLLSALGQPLEAEVEIVSLQPGEEGLSARLASSQAFAQAGIEPHPILSDVRFTIERRGATPMIVRLRSSQPVNEPFLKVLVELTSSTGSRVREYTLLLDPPR